MHPMILVSQQSHWCMPDLGQLVGIVGTTNYGKLSRTTCEKYLPAGHVIWFLMQVQYQVLGASLGEAMSYRNGNNIGLS